MGAPARSLGHLQGCADALREATKGRYSKGIMAAMKAMENAKLDFKEEDVEDGDDQGLDFQR
jgi:hypothetical protein